MASHNLMPMFRRVAFDSLSTVDTSTVGNNLVNKNFTGSRHALVQFVFTDTSGGDIPIGIYVHNDQKTWAGITYGSAEERAALLKEIKCGTDLAILNPGLYFLEIRDLRHTFISIVAWGTSGSANQISYVPFIFEVNGIVQKIQSKDFNTVRDSVA